MRYGGARRCASRPPRRPRYRATSDRGFATWWLCWAHVLAAHNTWACLCCTPPTRLTSGHTRTYVHMFSAWAPLQEVAPVPLLVWLGGAVQEHGWPAEEDEFGRLARRSLNRLQPSVKVAAEHERVIDGNELVAGQHLRLTGRRGARGQHLIHHKALALSSILDEGDAHRLSECDAEVGRHVVWVDEGHPRCPLTLDRLRLQFLVQPKPPVEWSDTVASDKRFIARAKRLRYAVEEPHVGSAAAAGTANRLRRQVQCSAAGEQN
mmetsp:Transcript_9692/g.19605  ORF Transcript_9692/g.19605 Transcript_9692/m.19605 type:complete len:264 (-) Transcript_9692:47-838(-)